MTLFLREMRQWTPPRVYFFTTQLDHIEAETIVEVAGLPGITF